MSGGRFADVLRRAAQRWDRGKVPPALDEGTTWERIQQKGRHIGARRRDIVHLEDSIRIDETLALAEGGYVGSWLSSLSLTTPPDPAWTAYSFSIGGEDPTTFVCESPESIPRFALYSVVTGIPFEAGLLTAITVLDDRTGEVSDESHLVSVGWDVAINGEWWRVDQYHEGERRAAYWLDAQHRLMRSDWEGAVLVATGSRAEALGDLAVQLEQIFAAEQDPVVD